MDVLAKLKLVDAYRDNLKSLCILQSLTESQDTDKEQILNALYAHLRNIELLIRCEKNQASLYAVEKLKEQLVGKICKVKSNRSNGKTDVNQSKTLTFIESSITQPQIEGLEQVVGCEEVKNVLVAHIVLPLSQPQLYTSRVKRNCILLFGPPGTGKTRLVHGLAAETRATFLAVTSANLVSSYTGETEKSIAGLFKYTVERDDFTILFIDEIDAFFRQRSGNESEHSRRSKSEFLCCVSNMESTRNLLICTTNCPWDLDSAFVRRFHRQIYVPLPNESQRNDLLQYYTRGTPLLGTSEEWTPLLRKTEGYSNADLKNLVSNALANPIEELAAAKLWKPVDHGKFEPVYEVESPENFFYSPVQELPPGSIKSREANLSDLFVASEIVKKTVSDSEIEQHLQYLRRT